MSNSHTYIKGYDSLRAISITMVVVSHLLPAGYSFYNSRWWILVSGTTGVQIFFALSGFLITTLLLKEYKNTGSINLYNFFIRRFLRLLPPLLVLYVLLLIAMLAGAIPQNYTGLVWAVFYLYNYVPNQYYTYELGHLWSLAVEEQFYIIWALVLRFVKQWKKIMLLVLLFVTVSIMSYYWLPTTSWAKNHHVLRWFFPASAPIFIGSSGAVILFYKPNWVHWIKHYAVILLVVLFYTFPLYATETALIVSPVIQAIGITILLIWILFNQQKRIVRLWDNWVLSYIGKISYGIYVYQGFFLRTGPGSDFILQQYPQNIILTLLLATLSYHYYEKPILKFKDKFRV